MNLKTFNLSRLWIFLVLFTLFLSCKKTESSEVSGDTTGVTDTEVVIGSWGPLTGPAALWGNALKGMDAYFKMINAEGGIHGRQIKFVFKDDAYDPSRTVPAVRELVQREEIFAITGGVGTATNMAVANFIIENEIPWINPLSGISYWTHPVKANIFSAFPLYFDEGNVMAEFILNELQKEKIGIIYQNDDFGKSGLAGAKSILKENNLDFVAALPVEITDTDLSSHIARLKESGAEAVLLWVLPRQAAIIMGTSAVVDFKPDWMASTVLGDITLMHEITKGAWEGVYFNYPSPVLINDESNETMMKYKAELAKHYPDDRWGLFTATGFLWSEITVEGLKRAGKDLTRESFLEAISNISGFEGLSGLTYNFSDDQHLGTRSMRIVQCISATEAKTIGEMIEGTVDIEEMEKMLHSE